MDIVEHVKPKYVIWENVKNLVSDKHRHNFDSYLITMRNLGYNSYYKVLNAKDYCVPQNRERVYVVSIRKDIDDGHFMFPFKEKLNIRLKDVLESNVSEHYYLNDDLVKKFIYKNKVNSSLLNTKNGKSGIVAQNTNVIGNLVMDKWYDLDKRIYDVNTYAPTLATQQGGNSGPKILENNVNREQNLGDSIDNVSIKVNRLGGLYDDEVGQRQGCSVFDQAGLAPTITTGHCFSQPFIIDNNSVKYNGKEVELPVVCASRGRNPNNPNDRTTGNKLEQRIEINMDGVSNTLTTFQKDNYVLEENKQNSGFFNIDDKDIDNPLKDKSGQSWQFEQNVYSEDTKCVRTIKAGGGSGNIPKIIEDNFNTNKEDNYSYVEKKYQEFYNKNGYIPEFFNPYNSSEIKDVAPTQTSNCGGTGSSSSILKLDKVNSVNTDEQITKPSTYSNLLRIRRLTPLECWRLMGFSDDDFYKAKNVPTSDTQLYKQAGNSIVVTVLEKIFKNLFKDKIKN